LWQGIALPWVLLVGLAAQASAIDVQGSFAVLRWAPSSGPVTSYAVYVDRNGSGFSASPSAMSPAPVTLLTGEPGDTIRVRVAAFGAETGQLSDFSEVSSTFRFVPQQPPASSPSLIENGSFENGGPGWRYWTAYGGQTLPGWEVLGHSIDWSGGFWAAADGLHSIDLNGDWGGGLRQTFATDPGGFYYVSYRVGALPECPPWGIKTFRIAAAGESLELDIDSTGNTRSDPGWFQPDPFVFRADSDQTVLEFSSTNGGGACGPLIDDVVVQAAQ
jgi:choice-of-anchor C domain-containing protein